MYELQFPPGSWPTSPPSTSKILWTPNRNEEGEGVRVLTTPKVLRSAPIDARIHMSDWDRKNYPLLVESVQDECGIIATRANRRRQHPDISGRSCTQPPSLSRRPLAHYKGKNSQRHPCLTTYHLCPHDGKLHFDCLFERKATQTINLTLLELEIAFTGPQFWEVAFRRQQIGLTGLRSMNSRKTTSSITRQINLSRAADAETHT